MWWYYRQAKIRTEDRDGVRYVVEIWRAWRHAPYDVAPEREYQPLDYSAPSC